MHGFTLVELMITVAIVGILTAIAYPVYAASILKGKRAQGRTALVEFLQQQERYMTQRNTYLAFTSAINGTVISSNPTSAATTFKLYAGDNSSNPAYILSAERCTAAATPTIAECVRVVANQNPAGRDPEAGDLRMTSTGTKDCTGTTTTPSICWP